MGETNGTSAGTTGTAPSRPLDDFLDEQTLARLLKVSRATIYGWRRAGMPYYRLGQRAWFRESAVVEWLDGNLTRSGTAKRCAASSAQATES